MRKTVYVILALCCFIIKTYSINRPYYHFKQLSIKEGLPTSITWVSRFLVGINL